MSSFSFEPSLVQVIYDLYKNNKLTKVILATSEAQAQKIEQTLVDLGAGFLAPEDILYIPGFFQTGVFKYESARKIIAKRLHAAEQLTSHFPRVFVCTVAGLTRNFPAQSWIKDNRFEIACGDDLDMDLLMAELSSRVYMQTARVEEVGEFAVRGSIMDLWTPSEKHPVRIEFSDDKVDKIRLFRVSDQRSFQTVDKVTILPSREFVWPAPRKMESALEKFNRGILTQGVVGTERSYLLEDLQANVPSAGIDDFFYMFAEKEIQCLHDQIVTLSKERKRDLSIELIEECSELLKSVQEIEKLYEKAVASSQSHNEIIGRKELVFPGLSSAQDYLKQKNVIASQFQIPDSILKELVPAEKLKFANRAEKLKELVDSKKIDELVFAAVSQDSLIEFSGMMAKYIPEFLDMSFQNKIGKFQASQIFEGVDPPVKPGDDKAVPGDDKASLRDDRALPGDDKAVSRDGKSVSDDMIIQCCQLNIANGFYFPNSNTLVISEIWLRNTVEAQRFENFEEEESHKSTVSSTEAFLSAQFSDFVQGDLVVHVQHGIARFMGLVTLKIADVTCDFLALEYAGGDKIYVPVHKLNLVQKYIGSSEGTALDSLKGNNWEKRKEKAQKDVEKIAKELMEYQAKRAMTPGHAFSKIDEDYIAFEDAFPFDETPDQLQAVREIMSDMGKVKAMDRLLCGDVGFGKTEVAMRAAYRCILDGKQVAWLVPTTVLAHQHFRSLKERFADFGVHVEMIDRSVTSSSKILSKLKNGEIDILIGTHRILSKDIAFRDLGLLVVDEEQRFGVMQKEKIKAMSYGVDVLTLTATPIPRTLQMAMVGLRELSLLTTPPRARLATKTFVCPFEDDLIRDAISFEISRGGQIFYVHNRVFELESVLAYLKGLVPSARICVAHGQMAQKDLESTILSFLAGQFDILLCTTIIESGIDMPNVNTIIVQNANHFGLAQLYQLRGRVGRRSTRGYAYFLTSENIKDDAEGMRRLNILKEHQELGSGFVVASHDLEMRGCGNILGDDQSGKVADVGLETYLQMLDDAIKHLGGKKVKVVHEVEIQIPITAQISESYIENSKERLRTYRRFFGTQNEQALAQLIAECEDRFGHLPPDVKNLSELARIRRLLVLLGAVSLAVGEDATEIRLDQKILQPEVFDEASEKIIKSILDVCNHRVKNMRLTPDGRILFPLRKKNFVQDESASLAELKRVLGLLIGEVAPVA